MSINDLQKSTLSKSHLRNVPNTAMHIVDVSIKYYVVLNGSGRITVSMSSLLDANA
jgi:hypothetical protein